SPALAPRAPRTSTPAAATRPPPASAPVRRTPPALRATEPAAPPPQALGARIPPLTGSHPSPATAAPAPASRPQPRIAPPRAASMRAQRVRAGRAERDATGARCARHPPLRLARRTSPDSSRTAARWRAAGSERAASSVRDTSGGRSDRPFVAAAQAHLAASYGLDAARPEQAQCAVGVDAERAAGRDDALTVEHDDGRSPQRVEPLPPRDEGREPVRQESFERPHHLAGHAPDQHARIVAQVGAVEQSARTVHELRLARRGEVDADADDDPLDRGLDPEVHRRRAASRLDEDAAELAPGELQVVGPLQADPRRPRRERGRDRRTGDDRQRRRRRFVPDHALEGDGERERAPR